MARSTRWQNFGELGFRVSGGIVTEPKTEEAKGTSHATGSQQPRSGLHERVENLSAGALVGWAVAMLVVGLVVGLGAGYKIEQTRTKNDVKNAKKKTAAAKPASTSKTAGAAVVGSVTATAPGSVTISLAGGGTDAGTTREFATSSDTTVVKATPGTASDITRGARVQYKGSGSSGAQEIIVLPADAKLGLSVTSVTPTSMTLRSNNGKDQTVNTQGATVDTVTTAPTSGLKVGDKILVQPSATNPSTAAEIIMLPNTSKFLT